MESARRESDDAPMIAQQQGFEMKRKRSSMVHFAGQPLPERVTVFDKLGNPSQVPLAQLGYHLGKRNKRTGERKFFRSPPKDAPPKPEIIDQTCEICLLRGVRKPFTSLYGYNAHMEA